MSAISVEGRQSLIDYKYKSSLSSWLEKNIMNDFWEWVVLFCPLWLPPNVITFAATIQFHICLLIFFSYSADFETCVDPWLYYMLAATIFIYQTLDAIDGKQARRTKQSSPLGQLFDHGNDAFNSVSFSPITLAILQIGTGWLFIITLMMSCVVFFSINWRARHSGVMSFGSISITELQLTMSTIAIITGMFGCDIWNIVIFGTPLNVVVLICGILGPVYNSCVDYFAVQQYYRDNPKKEDPGQVYELLHMVLFIIGFVSWYLSDIMAYYPVMYLTIASFIFSGILHRLIVADVTHMKSTKYYHLLDPLWIMIAGSLNVDKTKSIMISPYIAYGILIYVIIFWSLYVVEVINEICDTLNIRLFALNPPKSNAK